MTKWLATCPDWLRDAIEHLHSSYTRTPIAGGWLLATPWLLPDNTRLSVYILDDADGAYQVTDRGETIDDLFLSGLEFDPSDHRCNAIRARFGVTIDGGVISSSSDHGGLNEAILRVIHARLDLAYLIYAKS